jgi:hypothetical protein
VNLGVHVTPSASCDSLLSLWLSWMEFYMINPKQQTFVIDKSLLLTYSEWIVLSYVYAYLSLVSLHSRYNCTGVSGICLARCQTLGVSSWFPLCLDRASGVEVAPAVLVRGVQNVEYKYRKYTFIAVPQSRHRSTTVLNAPVQFCSVTGCNKTSLMHILPSHPNITTKACVRFVENPTLEK